MYTEALVLPRVTKGCRGGTEVPAQTVCNGEQDMRAWTVALTF